MTDDAADSVIDESSTSREEGGIVGRSVSDISGIYVGSILLSGVGDGSGKFGPLLELQFHHNNAESTNLLYSTQDTCFLVKALMTGIFEQIQTLEKSKLLVFNNEKFLKTTQSTLEGARNYIDDTLKCLEVLEKHYKNKHEAGD